MGTPQCYDWHAKPPYTTDRNQLSLYTRRYWSASKERFYCPEDLGRFHLVTAYNELAWRLRNNQGQRYLDPPDGSTMDAEMLAVLKRELDRRELDPAWVGGLKPGDTRLPQGKDAKRSPIKEDLL